MGNLVRLRSGWQLRRIAAQSDRVRKARSTLVPREPAAYVVSVGPKYPANQSDPPGSGDPCLFIRSSSCPVSSSGCVSSRNWPSAREDWNVSSGFGRRALSDDIDLVVWSKGPQLASSFFAPERARRFWGPDPCAAGGHFRDVIFDLHRPGPYLVPHQICPSQHCWENRYLAYSDARWWCRAALAGHRLRVLAVAGSRSRTRRGGLVDCPYLFGLGFSDTAWAVVSDTDSAIQWLH